LLSLFKNTVQKSNIAVLDGVRAVACLIVIAFHINLKTMVMDIWGPSSRIGPLTSAIAMTGYVGVTLFFVLSGLLLFMPYVKALLFEKQWPTMKEFYLRRALRILPGYYVSLALLILLTAPQYLHPGHLKELGLFLTFFMDSVPATYQKVNGPFWTLAVEWQFYMLLPLMALGLRWMVRHIGGDSLQRRWWTVVGCLVGLFAWGIFSRYWGGYFVAHADQTFLVPRSVLNVFIFFLYGSNGKYMEDFAIGMLISSCFLLSQQVSVRHRLRTLVDEIQRRSLWIWGAGIIVLLFMTMWDGNQWFRHSIPIFDPLYGPYAWLSESGFALGFGLCVLALLFGPGSLRLPFEWGPLRWIGLLSYSLYIWHLPIILAFVKYVQPLIPKWHQYLTYGLFWVCVLVVIIPFSFVFFKLIEQPWINLGNSLRKRKETVKGCDERRDETEQQVIQVGGSSAKEVVGSAQG